MQFETKQVSLADLAAPVPNAIAAGPFGSNLVSRDYVESGVPVIRGQNLAGRWVGGDFVYVSQEKAERLRSNTAKPGDVVFTQRGTLGQVSLVPGKPFDTYVVSQSQMKLTVDPSKADSRYVFYACTAPQFVRQVHNNAVAAGVPHINLGILRGLRIPLPPVERQQEIADVLWALDDKIALLRETNATLEAIAQALFKSWFVDFDAVRAKAEGREPEGMPPEVADLFPSEFEESGGIPKGWRATRLEQACDINPTRRLSKGMEAPYLEMAAVPTQGHRPETPALRAFSSGTKFVNGDTLLARITPCLENGKTAFVDFLSDGETGWGSTEYIVLRPKPPLPNYWAYLLCRHEVFRQFAIQAMVGTSGRQRVEVTRLAQYPVTVPVTRVAEAFSSFIVPLQERIAANDEAIKTLSSLRDTVLPKLMSGKVKDPLETVLNEEGIKKP